MNDEGQVVAATMTAHKQRVWSDGTGAPAIRVWPSSNWTSILADVRACLRWHERHDDFEAVTEELLAHRDDREAALEIVARYGVTVTQ